MYIYFALQKNILPLLLIIILSGLFLPISNTSAQTVRSTSLTTSASNQSWAQVRSTSHSVNQFQGITYRPPDHCYWWSSYPCPHIPRPSFPSWPSWPRYDCTCPPNARCIQKHPFNCPRLPQPTVHPLPTVTPQPTPLPHWQSHPTPTPNMDMQLYRQQILSSYNNMNATTQGHPVSTPVQNTDLQLYRQQILASYKNMNTSQ